MSSMPTAIRAAELKDVPAIRTLELQEPNASHWAANQYEKLIETGIVLVAVQSGTVCGFIAAQILPGELEIQNVVVGREFMRKGIATDLVCEIIARARAANMSGIILEVRESNHAARNLYFKSDFCAVGRRRAYYRNPQEDAILYAKRL
jgi:ribosomal-protein-alanine N-acetyltransferase